MKNGKENTNGPSDQIFGRLKLLIGEDAFKTIRSKRVIIFGVGGVGSWCAESLVRSGISHMTIVDNDNVDISNINRQLPATVDTVGRPKVDVMRERLLAINPDLQIDTLKLFYDEVTADRFNFNDYDYVVDCIDSLSSKMLLIMLATSSGARLFSSMGAALKSDPQRIKVAEFWEVKGCPLARALRDKFKRSGRKPRKKFKCVYSDELLKNKGQTSDTCDYKAQINGTLAHITAIFGFTLAGLLIGHAIASTTENC